MNKYKGFWIGFTHGAGDVLKIAAIVLLGVGGFVGTIYLLIWLSNVIGSLLTIVIAILLMVIASGIYVGVQQQKAWSDATQNVAEYELTAKEYRERVEMMERANERKPNSYSYADISLAKEDMWDAEYDLARAKERLERIEQFRNWR